MKKNRAKVGALLACGLSLSALSGCSLLPKEIDERKSPVVATQEPFQYNPDIVQRETIYNQEILYPKLVETGGVSLTFGENGRVGDVFVKEGAHVKEGELLAEMDYVPELREQVKEVEEQLASSRSVQEDLNYRKNMEIRECDIRRKYRLISKSEQEETHKSIEERYATQLEDISDQIHLQELQLELLTKRIDDGQIVSTIEGTVSMIRSQTVGQYVTNATPFAQIVDASVCMFELETEYVDYLKVGQKVAMELGTSVYCNTVVESIEGKRVRFLPEEGETFSMNVSARFFLVLDKRENVLTLTKTSIRYTDDGAYVFVVGDDGLRTMKEVTVGMEGGPADTSAKRRIEITSGLEQGEVIVGR